MVEEFGFIETQKVAVLVGRGVADEGRKESRVGLALCLSPSNISMSRRVTYLLHCLS